MIFFHPALLIKQHHKRKAFGELLDAMQSKRPQRPFEGEGATRQVKVDEEEEKNTIAWRGRK